MRRSGLWIGCVFSAVILFLAMVNGHVFAVERPIATSDVTASDSPSVEVTIPEFMVYSTRGDRGCWFLRDGCGALRNLDDGQAILQTESTTPLVILIHGNQTSLNRAVEMGNDLWQCLSRQEVQKFRLLVWSWDADRACLSVQIDSRIKASRADAQGILLAEFIRSLPSETPVILIGYSFGCRTAGGAAQLCGGGSWLRQRMPSDGEGVSVRPIAATFLLAAAMDDTNFGSQGAMNVALAAIDDCLVTVNPCDQALGLYPVISDAGCQAMGLSGPGPVPAMYSERIRQINIASEVGPLHQWECYFSSCSLRSLIVKAVRGAAIEVE